MIHFQLTRNKVYKWHEANGVCAKGFLFAPDGQLYRDADVCRYFSDTKDEPDFRQKLLSANGRFAVIIKKEKEVWTAVDRFNTFPLFYRQKADCLLISDEVDTLFAPEETKEIDEDAYLNFMGLTYVLGNQTLLKGVLQLQAGEYLSYENNQPSITEYHSLFAETCNIPFEQAKEAFKTILTHISQRMKQLIGTRPVYLSLSGGWDSRLLAYLLKKEGVRDVTCVSYGVKTKNPEWQRSQKTAERLGFKWLFIDYSSFPATDFNKQMKFVDFYNYVAQYVSKFGFIPYFMSNFLMDEEKISSDSIVMTGDGGDCFSGSHLRSYMKQYKSLSVIAKDIQYKRCNIVQLNNQERKKIKIAIQQSLKNVLPLFGNVENWEFKERQAKYILHSQKLWEFQGFELYSPLCDIELMDFFATLPFDYRLNQTLYKTVLKELFEEDKLNFEEDKVVQKPNIMQKLKLHIKRIFPFLRKKQNLFQYDYFDFKRFSQVFLKELQNQDRQIVSSNGILSEWYLMQIKKRIG